MAAPTTSESKSEIIKVTEIDNNTETGEKKQEPPVQLDGPAGVVNDKQNEIVDKKLQANKMAAPTTSESKSEIIKVTEIDNNTETGEKKQEPPVQLDGPAGVVNDKQNEIVDKKPPEVEKKEPEVAVGVKVEGVESKTVKDLSDTLSDDYFEFKRSDVTFQNSRIIIIVIKDDDKKTNALRSTESPNGNQRDEVLQMTPSMEHFRQLFREQKLCDLHIKANGIVLKLHKFVLTAHSGKYLERFKRKDSDKAAGVAEITLNDVSPAIAKSVVEYLYDGHIDISEGTIDSILNCAIQLDITPLLGECMKYLERFNADTVLNHLQLTVKHGLMSAINTDEMIRLCAERFAELVETEGFRALTHETLSLLLSTEEVHRIGENVLLKAVCHWLNRDLSQRLAFSVKLLEKVRLEQASPALIQQWIEENQALSELPEVKKMLFKAYKVNIKMAAQLLQLSNFIGGRFLPFHEYLDSFNPSTGRIWAKVPDSGENEVNDAVEAAKRAFPGWSSLSPEERSGFLLKIADILEKRCDEFALAESNDQGKTLAQAKIIEMPRAVLNFRHFGNSILYTVDRSKLTEELGVVNYTVRQPVGVAGLISPWNLPLYLLTFKIAPAIATGNTVVCKPSEMTSVTAWMFCEVLQEAGLPAGVVNMVFGTGPKAGEVLVKHPDVSIISFTGSTLTGQRIYRLAADNFKKLSLEMGGKNAGIIFEDADLNKCIPTTIRSSFLNQGEVCLCTSRLYVQRSIFDEFVRKFVAEVKKIKVGSPLDSDTFMGALISREHLAKVRRYVEIAKAEGATLLTDDNVDSLKFQEENRNGYFMLPVVITDIKDMSACMTDEIFGPVVCIVPFDTEENVIQRANALKYGLCASVWSANAGRVHRVAHKLQVGTVWANCWLIRCLDMPFGGCKHSGIGREGTQDSLELFTEIKTVAVSLN